MRQAGSLANEQEARRFADYLLTLEIQTRVDQEKDGWVIWVHHEDHLDQAKEELRSFRENPDDPRYQEAGKSADAIRKDIAKKEQRARKLHVDVRKQWDQGIRCPLTMTLIVASVLVAIASGLAKEGNRVTPILSIANYTVRINGKIDRWRGLIEVRAGQVWRLVTPIFIHLNFWHLLFNMYWLYQFGTMIEIRRGIWRLGMMVLAIAVTSNLVQYWVSVQGAGMSGVGFGLFGYLWMKSRFDPWSGMRIDQQTVVLFIAWFFICMTGWVGPIANWAHGVGLVMGIAIGYAPTAWKDLRRN